MLSIFFKNLPYLLGANSQRNGATSSRKGPHALQISLAWALLPSRGFGGPRGSCARFREGPRRSRCRWLQDLTFSSILNNPTVPDDLESTPQPSCRDKLRFYALCGESDSGGSRVPLRARHVATGAGCFCSGNGERETADPDSHDHPTPHAKTPTRPGPGILGHFFSCQQSLHHTPPHAQPEESRAPRT